MNKQVMIDKIYEVITDKKINMWCKICRYHWIIDTVLSLIDYWKKIDLILYSWINKNIVSAEVSIEEIEQYKIIWHPVMIGDVLDWIDKNIEKSYEYADWPFNQDWHTEKRNTIILYREAKRKPIEEQSEKCILFIYNLINE